jgi:hypothetical protein
VSDWYGVRDEACPLSTGGGVHHAVAVALHDEHPAREARAHARDLPPLEPELEQRVQLSPQTGRDETCPISTG